MSVLLAGLPVTVPAATVNRLCGSGMNAVGNIADSIRTGGMALGIAGGVESMSRAPFVMPKQADAFGRNTELYDTTLGWRFVNKKLEEQYGIDSMAETAENVAAGFLISREDQDAFALRSQLKAEAAMAAGRFDDEIIPVSIPQRRGDDLIVAADEHPRPGSTLEALAKLRPIVRSDRAAGARCWLGRCWGRASHHGHWSGACFAKSPRDLRIDDRTDGRYRIE
jgi:acetyl-CoA acetyltransferase